MLLTYLFFRLYSDTEDNLLLHDQKVTSYFLSLHHASWQLLIWNELDALTKKQTPGTNNS